MLAADYTSFNHGSYGTVPKPVAQTQYDYYAQCEAAPDKWLRTTYFDKIVDARTALAEVVNADSPDNLVLVENASAAVNSILRSLGLKSGDKFLRLSTAYGMVINTLNWLVSTAGIEVIIVPVEFPIKSSQQIIDSVQMALIQSPGVKLSVFSHISSIPAVIEPIFELQALARAAGSMVLIDGAHAPGAIKVDLKQLAPDFYLGNAHKWLFCPKGTAFLYVRKELQTSTAPEPTVINLDPTGLLPDRYKYTGTRDYTAMATIPACIAFFGSLGGMSNVAEYNHNLAVQGGAYLAAAWNTSFLVPPEMTGTMANIMLPASWSPQAIASAGQALLDTYNTMVVLASVLSGGTTGDTISFLRLSAQVYLSMEEIQWLADMLPKLVLQYQHK